MGSFAANLGILSGLGIICGQRSFVALHRIVTKERQKMTFATWTEVATTVRAE